MTDTPKINPDEAAKAAAADAEAATAEAAAAAEAAEAAAPAATAAKPGPATKAKPAVPTDISLAAQKRAEAAKGGKLNEAERMIAALEVERQGYVQRGNDERVKQVDASIAAWKKKGKA